MSPDGRYVFRSACWSGWGGELAKQRIRGGLRGAQVDLCVDDHKLVAPADDGVQVELGDGRLVLGERGHSKQQFANRSPRHARAPAVSVEQWSHVQLTDH